LEFSDIFGNLAAKILGFPCVCTFHTIPNPPEKIKHRLHQWLWWNIIKLFSNKVISVAENAREYYIDVFGINPEKVITIYNGINISRFGPINKKEQTSLRRDLNIPNGAILLLTVAMLRPLKGIQYMIRALPKILVDYPTICYLVVGSGPYLQVLKDQAKAIGLEKNIRFVGLRKDVPKILSLCEIFVLPSLTEALPTVLAEAMAARIPIIASAVGGVPEMVYEGQNGFLITPGDTNQLANACIQLLKASDIRKEMGLFGWEIVNQKFNIHNQIEQLKSLYFKCINDYERTN
jgi:glycosyltransferase involved in cell wall biosynthesis